MRVGGQRAARIDAVGDEPLDRGRNDRAVLLAERAVLAGVRIEAGDREPRPRDAEALGKIARHDAAGLEDQSRRQPLRHLLAAADGS